ncbi:MFS transporter [Nocardia sp. NPDC051750]|uniref:MFS transporter n=1 Tax=Nocardia sp. NPDC051750 TaxID=3364325 RepID=UPI003794A356
MSRSLPPKPAPGSAAVEPGAVTVPGALASGAPPVAGRWRRVLVAARVRRKNVLVVFCGLWGVWSAAAGLSQNFAQLLVLYGIAAMGFAAGGPLINGILADLFDDNSRGRASGLLYGGFALLSAISGPLLGQLSRVPDGWRYGFFVSGGLTVVNGLFMSAMYRPYIRESASVGAIVVARNREKGFA